MFKELVFELSGGRSKSAHTRRLVDRPGLAARMQIIHATPDLVWELISVSGDADGVACLRAELESGLQPPMLDLEIVSAAPRLLQYVVKWPRPKDDEAGTSLEFLLYDVVGPDALFRMRIENGRIEARAAGPDGEKLLRYYNLVRARLESRFRVRLLRVGDLRPGWDETRDAPSTFRDEDRQLVAFALAAGYYDNPKRCGVRELGDALGWSKSVVARKLRSIERRALENLVPSEAAEAGEVRVTPVPALVPTAAARGLERAA